MGRIPPPFGPKAGALCDAAYTLNPCDMNMLRPASRQGESCVRGSGCESAQSDVEMIPIDLTTSSSIHLDTSNLNTSERLVSESNERARFDSSSLLSSPPVLVAATVPSPTFVSEGSGVPLTPPVLVEHQITSSAFAAGESLDLHPLQLPSLSALAPNEAVVSPSPQLGLSPRRNPIVSFDDPNYVVNLRRQLRERARLRRAVRADPVAPLGENEYERAARLAREAQQVAERRRQRQRTSRNCFENLGLNYRVDTDYQAFRELSIGSLTVLCPHCQAKKFPGETIGLCCQSGQVRLNPIEQPPQPILSLFSGDHELSRHFLSNIRHYNSCFQMTSFGVDGTESHEWSTFKVHGQIYHCIGSLLPVSGAQPSFLQIYFMGDPSIQVDRRLEILRNPTSGVSLRRTIVESFQQLFDNHNRLIRSFRTALSSNLLQDNNSARVVIREDRTPVGEHERRFNAPVDDDEVAIVMVGDENATHRDIVIRQVDGGLRRITETHPMYDGLQYPIIFWRGSDSYHINIRRWNPSRAQQDTKKVSAMDFYSYQLMIRDDSHNFILKCCRLLNQFVVDSFAKIESERLLWIRLNQATLRRDQYVHLRDALANDIDPRFLGERVILPSTHIGSPRHMAEYAQDAMAYVRLHGRPDLFITFTCNPNWPEIVDNLMPGQDKNSRHDLIARVFNMKVKKLVQVLTSLNLFGPISCFMFTIEWQKRGLPHTHILLWLCNKISPQSIDQVISAEIPDPNLDPILHAIVVRNMIHGPCGPLHPGAICMKDNLCSKKYPRTFVDHTITGDDGYPLYRRRSPANGGQELEIQRNSLPFRVDNSWVVPFNPVLLRLFDAHINVEYCHSVKSIKYICKYINKGSDMAVIERRRDNDQNLNVNDEVRMFQLGRYLNTNEAFWRIFGFSIHDKHPVVLRLHVHLQDEQYAYFNELNAARIAANPPSTTLTAFFELCSTDEFARTLLYSEVASYYTYSRPFFQRRKRGAPVPGYPGVFKSDAIGRVYTVHPAQAERFYLRMLLMKVRGPTSFEDLRTFPRPDGAVYSTYREVCDLMGLLESDAQWAGALHEAVANNSPSRIRSLFCVIITHCHPSDPLALWETFKEALSEDNLYNLRVATHDHDLNFNEQVFNMTLIQLEDLSRAMGGQSLAQIGLPAPNRGVANPLNPEIVREQGYDVNEMRALVDSNQDRLTPDQRVVFDTITRAISEGKGGFFFLEAPGGTGKTFLINYILAHQRLQGNIVLAVASSGIAATLLAGGRTAHSAFKIPLDLFGSPSCAIARGTQKAELMRRCVAIIWDECTMAHKKSLEAVNRCLQDLRDNDRSLFGGVVLILAGDFRQTLPVVKHGTPADEIDACLKSSELWRGVVRLSLTTNMRVHLRNDPNAQVFSRTLLSVGNGEYEENPQTSLMFLREDLCRTVPSVNSLYDAVFPNLSENINNRDWLCERAILAPKNDMVHELNLAIQNMNTNGRARYYFSVDRVMDEEQAAAFPVEFLNSLSPSGFPPHELAIKVGSPIILLRNLDPPRLCNGTRLVVTRLHNNHLEGIILAGACRGETVLIPRIPLITDEVLCTFKRVQFPVRLAFAMTINKSQGQTLGIVGIDLTHYCFSHGQLYVACSRVGASSNIHILAPGGETRNVVYRQVLE